MLNILIWLCGALVVAGAIAWDMQALRVNRVGWPAFAWWCASVLAWPVAGRPDGSGGGVGGDAQSQFNA